MASKEEMERLIGKVIADNSFRDQFLKNPNAAASEIGIKLTPQQEEAFKKKEFSKMAGELEKVASKSGFAAPIIK
jgi:putative modified peptide